jgi:hypothetical protein
MLVDCCVVSNCAHPEVWVQETIFPIKRIMLVSTRVQSRFFQQNCVVGVEDEIQVGICIRGGRIGNTSSRV